MLCPMCETDEGVGTVLFPVLHRVNPGCTPEEDRCPAPSLWCAYRQEQVANQLAEELKRKQPKSL